MLKNKRNVPENTFEYFEQLTCDILKIFLFKCLLQCNWFGTNFQNECNFCCSSSVMVTEAISIQCPFVAFFDGMRRQIVTFGLHCKNVYKTSIKQC